MESKNNRISRKKGSSEQEKGNRIGRVGRSKGENSTRERPKGTERTKQTPVREVKRSETDHPAIEIASRQRFPRLLGKELYLSSEVKARPDGTALEVRIDEEQLIAQDFTTIISVLTEFHTQFWLIQQGRFEDLDEYMQTQDSRFVEEANLIIDNLSFNSPALITLLTDPGTITGIVTTTVTLALALQKIVEVISKVLIQSRKDRLDLKKEEGEYVKSIITTYKEYVDTLYPNADSEKKAEVMKDMIPNLEEWLKELLKVK